MLRKLKKPKIKDEDWILLSLLGANKRQGINLTNWFLTKRPRELDKLEPQDFHKIVDKLKADGQMETTIFEHNYCLTEKGEHIARALKKKLSLTEYKYLISNFPDIEFHIRIQTLEKLVISVAIFIFAYFLGQTPMIFLGNNVFLMGLLVITYITVLIFSIVYTSFYFVQILFSFFIDLQRDTLWKYKEWAWNNRTKIIYPVPALLVIVTLLTLYNLQLIKWDQNGVIISLVLTAIIEIAKNYKKIVAKLTKK